MRLRRFHWMILLVIVVVFLTAIPLVFLEFGRPGLQGLSIIASAFLTLGLVVLYWQQHHVLRNQQLPQLDISDYDMTDNFRLVHVDISNVGGGPATALKLRIDLYELSGEGPLQTARGGLRRMESVEDGTKTETLSSSIRPSEINISFEAESKGVLGSGSGTQNQDSLATMVAKEFENDRGVLYGKISIEYTNKFSEEEEYEADFSLKFTHREEIEYELFEFQPWADNHQNQALGG